MIKRTISKKKIKKFVFITILVFSVSSIITATNIYENLYSFKPKQKIENPDPDFELKQKVKERIRGISSREEAESKLVWVEVPV